MEFETRTSPSLEMMAHALFGLLNNLKINENYNKNENPPSIGTKDKKKLLKGIKVSYCVFLIAVESIEKYFTG